MKFLSHLLIINFQVFHKLVQPIISFCLSILKIFFVDTYMINFCKCFILKNKTVYFHIYSYKILYYQAWLYYLNLLYLVLFYVIDLSYFKICTYVCVHMLIDTYMFICVYLCLNKISLYDFFVCVWWLCSLGILLWVTGSFIIPYKKVYDCYYLLHGVYFLPSHNVPLVSSF